MSEHAAAGSLYAIMDQTEGNDLGGLENTDGNVFGIDLRALEEEMEAEDLWRPPTHAIQWVHEKMVSGVLPLEILEQLMQRNGGTENNVLPSDLVKLLPSLDNATLWHIIIQISVSCGIPDFRSKHGIYARLHAEFPDLPDPQAMFDIDFFTRNPKPFFKFAKEIYPGQFEPSKSHKFIATLEREQKLLRNYTQNIDTLEMAAGIRHVIQCHGSFATATCCLCRAQYSCADIKEDILAQRIPYCTRCTMPPANNPASETTGQMPNLADPRPTEQTQPSAMPRPTMQNVIKPDIVFFGESLPGHFHDALASDKRHADLLIVMGSSLKVRPVALIPDSLPGHVPQILINNQPLPHVATDVELIGDCDTIVTELALRLGGAFREALCEKGGREPRRRVTPEHPEFLDGHTARDTAAMIQHEMSAHEPGEPPSAKRARPAADGSQTAANGTAKMDAATASPSERRQRTPEVEHEEYVELEANATRTETHGPVRIPPGCYVSVCAHRHLFPGADVHYSAERGCTVPGSEPIDLNSTHNASASSSSSSSSDSSDGNSSSDVETRSLDGFVPVSKRRRKHRVRCMSLNM